MEWNVLAALQGLLLPLRVRETPQAAPQHILLITHDFPEGLLKGIAFQSTAERNEGNVGAGFHSSLVLPLPTFNIIEFFTRMVNQRIL